MGVLAEIIFFAVMATLVLVGAAVWGVINLLVWLVGAIWAAVKPELEELWQDIQREIEEAQKPQQIREAGQAAREQMASITDQFLVETTEFLQGQGTDGPWRGE